VSIAALQIDTDWQGTGQEFIRQSMSKVVAADGWESHPEALKVHGLTEDYTREVGRTEKEVLDEFLHLWVASSNGPFAHVIAHNVEFDHTLIAIALARYYPHNIALQHSWQETERTCTMLSSKDIVQAQSKPHATTGKTRLKNPRLDEAFAHFYPDEDLIANRHSASADTVACWQIFKALQAQEG
jgi:DNA polymerase III epsilon subunit-like protein